MFSWTLWTYCLAMRSGQATESLHRWCGPVGRTIPALLLTSLGLNIVAVVAPFLAVEKFLQGDTYCSLPRSVLLLWERDLKVVSILILAFSIIFPFLKLIYLAKVWFGQASSHHRLRMLHAMEMLGKFSFLDIFVVILMLVITDRQFWVEASPRYGVYFFLGAITLNMVTAQLILTVARRKKWNDEGRPAIPEERRWPLTEVPRLGWTVPLLLVVSASALFAAFDLPFLKINEWFFSSHSYSILSATEALHNRDFYLLSSLMLLVLAAFPCGRMIIIGASWCLPLSRRAHERAIFLSWILARWSMLDVFVIALFLVMAEGRHLVRTQVQEGLYVVVAAAGISYLMNVLAAVLHRSIANGPPSPSH